MDRDNYWAKDTKCNVNNKEVPEGIIIKKRRRGEQSDLSSVSVGSSLISDDKKLNKKVTDNSLHPTQGALKCRLDLHMHHLPNSSKSKNPRCALHRWAWGKDGKAVMSNIISCSICGVDLCVPCYKKFHLEADLTQHKESLQCN